MNDLPGLITAAAADNPAAPIGTFRQQDRLDRVVERAWVVAAELGKAGVKRGDLVAIIGTNCAAYIVTWLAAQLAGIRTALLNPGYPDEFLATMLEDLLPSAIIWVARAPGPVTSRPIRQFDASGAWDGTVVDFERGLQGDAVDETAHEGADRIAAYLHTSGTSGNPKFCALSHQYFLRLGRYFADVMAFTHQDIVFNPLPLFHINPLGNGLIGALTGRAGFLSVEKFAAGDFWPMVKAHGVTALILHAPPANLLKAKTRPAEAEGHKVRIGFACDPEFLRLFEIPIGIGGYGSTEAAGFCHSWKFRAGDEDLPAEGALHLAGQPRHDIDWQLSAEEEILVRGKAAEVLFSGYAKAGQLSPALNEAGWFHTGDRGRLDAFGNLIFVERQSESIRVNAEYVPIGFVEDRLRGVVSLGDFALWKVPCPARGHQPVIYTTSANVDVAAVRAEIAGLPRYMQPTEIITIDAIPRDFGVGKVQRRLLSDQPARQVQPL